MTSEGSASAISNELWSAALSMLEPDHSKPVFEMFLKPMRILTLGQTEFVLATPTAFARDWAENHLKNSIHAALRALTGFNGFTLRFVIAPPESAPEPPLLEEPLPQQTPAPLPIPVEAPLLPEEPIRAHALLPPQASMASQEPIERALLLPPPPLPAPGAPTAGKPAFSDEVRPNNLNPRYTFEEFVVGTFNSFAHAAAQAVADAPARAYNPLFLYGGVGLGKTHLMHAIGHHVLVSNPKASVVYVSSEKFTNDFIVAIKNNQAVEFRAKYRHVDILMIDDIQFLEGKEQTQEEFFHTFNTLHEASKQIIISSDRPPKEIQTLENRLRSRFEWGLLIDVQPPDLETREAILRKKAESEKLPVPDQVTSYIAKAVVSNIRELEGALIRVVAFASLTKSPITCELAAEVLKNVVSITPRRITISIIKEKVAKAHGLTIKEIDHQRRDKRIAGPRQIAMYLAAELTDSSLPQIAREFQKKDHTTVMYARDRVKELMTADESYRNKVLSLAALCESE